MKKIIFFLLFLTVSSLAAPVQAQLSSALSVSPVIYNISLSPGKVYRYSLKVKNGLDAPVPVAVELQNLDVSQRDETDSALRSIVPWVTLPDRDMIIDGKSERTIDFTVKVPDRVPLGGYYGMVYLHPFSRTPVADTADIGSKIGILLLGSVGVQELPLNKIELQSPGMTRFFNSSNEVILDFAVKNTALNHFSAKPFLRIRPLFGPSQDIALEEKIIFPGRTRNWSTPVTLSSYPNLWYRADLVVSVGGGQQKKASVPFIAFPLSELFLFIIAALAVTMVMRNRKRFRRFIRVLLKG